MLNSEALEALSFLSFFRNIKWLILGSSLSCLPQNHIMSVYLELCHRTGKTPDAEGQICGSHHRAAADTNLDY